MDRPRRRHPADRQPGPRDETFRCWGRTGTDFETGLWAFETIKPGRVAAIHVKDRILYGHQNEWHTTAVWPFSDDCNRAFIF